MNETSLPLSRTKRKIKAGAIVFYQRAGMKLKDLPKPPKGFLMEPSTHELTGESVVKVTARCWPEDKNELMSQLSDWALTNNLRFGNY